jgi:hypothetical protein
MVPRFGARRDGWAARRTGQDYNAPARTDHFRSLHQRRPHGTIRAVTTRRGARPSQVRPRPPSSGKPVQAAVRSRPSQTTRLSTHRKVERGPGIAWPFRLLLVAAIAALGVGVLLAASGGLGRVAASIGSSFGSFVSNITATPLPSVAPIDVADAPVLAAPDEPYTNQGSIDLVGTVPDAVVGDGQSRIRIYVALGDQPPGIVTEVPVGDTTQFTVPGVKLATGTNTFTATIIGPTDLESDASAAVVYVLDKTKPRVTVSSPKNNAIVNGATVRIVGQTQGRSSLSVTNATTAKTVNGAADAKGTFSVVVGLRTGANTIQISATDPAGNAFTATLTLRRGTGKLTASLVASDYSISRRSLPEPVTLAVVVTDPDGQRLSGANTVFTLTVPGLPVIVSPEVLTDGNGRASFTTTIPKGATKGQAKVTVMVNTTEFGYTSDLTVINIH